MKSLRRPLLIILAALCGLAAGFAFRAWRAPDSTQPQASAALTAEASSHPTGALRRLQLSGALTKTEQDLSLSTGVTRWLVWMTAVEKATLADFPALARMGKDLPGALRMLSARWIELNPRHLFETCMTSGTSGGFPQEDLLDMLFQEWPARDPAAAIAALTDGHAGNGCPDLRMDAANMLFKTDPECALIAMSAWHIEGYGPDMKKCAEWAAANPQHAAGIALGHPAGYATELVVAEIGKAWGQSDPKGALKYMSGKTEQYADQLRSAVMSGWAARDMPAASAWLTTADERTRRQLLPPLVQEWSKLDAPAALAWCLTNTSGGEQQAAVRGLMKGAVSSDINTAAALVSSLEPSPTRTAAAGALAEAAQQEDWFSLRDGKPGAAPEVIAWLSNLDRDSLDAALRTSAHTWSRLDNESFAAFLASPACAEAAGNYVRLAAPPLLRSNPAKALEWATGLPEKARYQAQRIVLEQWHTTQPEAAHAALDKLAVSDTQRTTLRQVLEPRP